MKKLKLFPKIIALILVISTAFCNQAFNFISASAAEDQKLATEYVSEVKVFYGINYEDVKSQAEKDGYYLCPENLKDGHSGNEVATYLGYKTTDDPGDAITDLTLLDMKNSHYEEMTYGEFLDKHIKDFANQAAQIMVLVNEFRRQYKQGSPNALAAYDSLNLIYMEEDKSHTSSSNLLGDYILNKADITFFEKYIQRGNSEILSCMVGLLGKATSDYEKDGTTWVDRAKKSAITEMYARADSAEINQYNGWYKDYALKLIREIDSFAETYMQASILHEQFGNTFGYESVGITEETTIEEMLEIDPNCLIPEYVNAMMLYDIMNQVVYTKADEAAKSDAELLFKDGEATEFDFSETYSESKTLAEYFMDLAADENLSLHPEAVYPLIEGMSTAQRTALDLCGLGVLVKGLFQAEDYESQRKNYIADAENDLKDLGFKDGKIFLWANTQTDLYSKLAVETSDAIEAKYSGKDLDNSLNEAARKAASTLTIALQIIDITLMAVSGITMIIQAIVGVSLWAAGIAVLEMAGCAMAVGLTGLAVAWGVAGVLACATFVLSIVVLVASLAYMVYTILDMCGCFDEPELADYDTIPEIMFHTRTNMYGNYYLRYDVVKSNATLSNYTRISFKKRGMSDEEIERLLAGESVDPVMAGLAMIAMDWGFSTETNDMGMFMGVEDRWMTLYSTKAPAAGSPIAVVPGESFIVTQHNNYQAPAGTRPISLVSNSLAEDINAIEIGGDKGTPLYMFIKTASPLADASGDETETEETETEPAEPVTEESTEDVTEETGAAETEETEVPQESESSEQESETVQPEAETPQPETETAQPETETAQPETETKEPESQEPESTGSTSAGETIASDQYITRVRLSHASKMADAQNALRKDGFMNIIDVNLTPYDGYTYLGYQMGSENGAITDIRLSTIGVDPLVFGEASYARAGLPSGGITPDGMALYVTSSKAAGTPITRISVETKRLEMGSGAEPVCLFSGGNAVDFKHKWSDNYSGEIKKPTLLQSDDMTETRQDDTEDGYYIYFWPKEQYKADNPNAKRYVAGFSYFLAPKVTETASNADFMQTFAANNGFELLEDNGSPATMMTDDASRIGPVYNWKDCEGGALGHDWRYDMWHYMNNGSCNNFSDGGWREHDWLFDVCDESIYKSKLYFGVSYTYNPYRAITGIAGLLSPYTETTHSIKYTGLSTPSGTLQSSNVSIMGNPITNAGIAFSYYNAANMPLAFYPEGDTWQHAELSWMTDKPTEIQSHYLLTNGPVTGLSPICADEIAFGFGEDAAAPEGYVPIVDLRTPGDYEHPMNFALSTYNKGSKYLYIYQRKDAGGRTDDTESNHNEYTKKHYVAGVFVGTGKTDEEAINNLYSRIKSAWPTLVSNFPDLPSKPLVAEFDEIYTVDLSDTTPWYTLYHSDTEHCDPSDDEWVYGNPAAHQRWGHDQYSATFSLDHSNSGKTAEETEKLEDHAYIGVVRTCYAEEQATVSVTNKDGSVSQKKQTIYPVYGLLKYYTNDASASSTLTVGSTNCTLAGGPVKSSEGQYYLYYSTNSATAPFAAPVTEIDISDEAFINGFNTAFSCSNSDRVNYVLPEYATLRMRTDETFYIHTKYDMADLPYIERLYIGIGNNKKEAYADLIGTSNASAATSVNCNHNSYSDKWIAIGYRRTAKPENAIKDLFLYAGENPPDNVQIPGYTISETKRQGKVVQKFTEENIQYNLIKHNLKVGSEVLSLNEGSGGLGLYLYYASTSKRFTYEQDSTKEIFPVRNIAFGYGDISPLFATEEDLGKIYRGTMYGMKIFDTEAYRDPTWEYLLGIEAASPAEYKMDGSNGKAYSLNYGQLPTGDKKHTSGDKRVIMYLDRGSYEQTKGKEVKYAIRPNAQLANSGYYAATTTFGVLQQTN